jgi:hypothetical protein
VAAAKVIAKAARPAAPRTAAAATATENRAEQDWETF